MLMMLRAVDRSAIARPDGYELCTRVQMSMASLSQSSGHTCASQSVFGFSSVTFLSENRTSLDFTNEDGFHINPTNESQVVENVEGVLRDLVALRSLVPISIRRESTLTFAHPGHDCTRSYRPDILIVRDKQFVCGCVEVKRPLFFTEQKFPDVVIGQVYEYLLALRCSGVKHPLALLTDYNTWVVCALPGWAWPKSTPTTWSESDVAQRKWPKTGVPVERVFLHTLVSEEETRESLGVPRAFLSGKAQPRDPVFKIADCTSEIADRQVLVSEPVMVNQKNALLDLVGSFLVHCLFSKTAAENLTRVWASGKGVWSSALICGRGHRSAGS
jgi:hypothetical protein